MTREEYVNEVLSLVKSKYAKAEIEQELNDHIDDRIEYYTEAGYDYEYALYKAMEYMGEPEQVGANLNNIHNETPLLIASIVLQGIFLFSMLLLILTSRYQRFVTSFGLNYEIVVQIQLLINVLLFDVNYYICSRHSFHKPTFALGIEAFLMAVVGYAYNFKQGMDAALSSFYIEPTDLQKFFGYVFDSYSMYFMIVAGIVTLCYGAYMKARLNQRVHSTIELRYYNFNKIFAFFTVLLLGFTIFICASV